jgi:hypothetical protein
MLDTPLKNRSLAQLPVLVPLSFLGSGTIVIMKGGLVKAKLPPAMDHQLPAVDVT